MEKVCFSSKGEEMSIESVYAYLSLELPWINMLLMIIIATLFGMIFWLRHEIRDLRREIMSFEDFILSEKNDEQ